MKETKVMDKIHKDLVKKYHTLAGQLGMTDEDRRSFLSQFNVESSVDLSQHQLIDACAALSRELEKRYGKENLDTLRKRVIKCIGDYLKAAGEESNIYTIKATACTAARVTDFNKIPRERLRSLYGAFRQKKADWDSVDAIHEQMKKMKLK